MHGVKRTAPPSASVRAERKRIEAAKLASYLQVEAAFFSVRDQGQVDQAALDATTALLTVNPELYTVWNYRRKVLAALFAQGSAPAPAPAPKKDFFAAAREPAGAADAAASAATADDAGARRLKADLLQDDLELTMHALRAHPKVYWIWNHRKWCLIELPNEGEDEGEAKPAAKWTRELGIVDRMLEMDPRNFHGWDYRRYLVSQIAGCVPLPPSSEPSSSSSCTSASPPPHREFPYSLEHAADLPAHVLAHHLALARSELAYTLRKIEANFSNFSAWHWRSKLLPGVWAAEGKDAAEKRRARDQEFELLRQAMYTDPADQSVWLYHSWLVDLDPSEDVLEREIASIEELLEVEPDSKWCIESLARYKYALAGTVLSAEAQAAGTAGTAGEAGEARAARAAALRASSAEHLRELVRVDPDRKGRYLDLLEERGRAR